MAPPLSVHIGTPEGHGSPHSPGETGNKQDSESKRSRNYQLPQLSGLRTPTKTSPSDKTTSVSNLDAEKTYDEQPTEESACEESSISSETNSETGSNMGTFDLSNLKISPPSSQSSSLSQKAKLSVGELIREENVSLARHHRTFVKTTQAYRMALDCADPAGFVSRAVNFKPDFFGRILCWSRSCVLAVWRWCVVTAILCGGSLDLRLQP
eukprot:761232-Hanusia_phi.AAC.3